MKTTLNFANLLTLFRIASIPLIATLFFSSIDNARPIAAIVFILAALTDWFDGWVAREYDLSSRFGAFLDPVADKLVVSVALILIVQSDPSLTNAVIASIIIGREITISALREWMAELGERHHVSVIGFAKLKTILQMVGLSCMLFSKSLFGIDIYLVGTICLIGSVVLTLWTMFIYLFKAWPTLIELMSVYKRLREFERQIIEKS